MYDAYVTWSTRCRWVFSLDTRENRAGNVWRLLNVVNTLSLGFQSGHVRKTCCYLKRLKGDSIMYDAYKT